MINVSNSKNAKPPFHLFELARSRASQQHWMWLLEDQRAVSSPIPDVTHFLRLIFFFSLRDWSALLKSVNAYTDLDIMLRNYSLLHWNHFWEEFQNLFITHYQNPVWVRNHGLSHNTGSCPQAKVWRELQKTVLEAEGFGEVFEI